jgi:hypothetical protein
MTKNKLTDLNDHLFMALERLNDEDLEADALQVEVHRARAVADVASRIIANGNLSLKAMKFKADQFGTANTKLPPMLGGE